MKIFLLVAVAVTITHGNPVQDFSNGNLRFTSDIYKEHRRNASSNFLLSPISAEIVLALTQSGAKDATARELRSSLHLPDDDQAIRSGIRSYLASLKQSSNEYQLHSANKIYVKKDLAIKDEFKQVAISDYQADIENVDFARKEEAAGTINQWVEKQTHDKIRNLMDPQSLGDSVAAVLINTLYFQGRWMSEFSKEATKRTDFYRGGTDAVQADLMYKYGKSYPYFESSELDARFLELPFLGRDVSFVVALPNKKDGLAALEEKAEEVFAKHDFGKFEQVNLALPKFKIESKVDFKKILEQLGVSKIFSKEADLSGIAGEKGDMSVAEVVQKTFIDVNEEGVEAAAATEVLPVLGSSFNPDPPKEFIVDRPFVFYIKANDVVLFAGRVVDPTK